MSAILDRAKKYSAEIQKRTRAEQLAWFREQFEIAPEPLLRLLGYSPRAIRDKLAAGATVEELAEKKPNGTLWMTEIFRELVHRHGYDVGRLAETFREAPVAEETVKIRKGGEELTHEHRLPIATKLAREIRTGGPGVYWALTQYLRLAHASSSAGRNRIPASVH